MKRMLIALFAGAMIASAAHSQMNCCNKEDCCKDGDCAECCCTMHQNKAAKAVKKDGAFSDAWARAKWGRSLKPETAAPEEKKPDAVAQAKTTPMHHGHACCD